jgi:hypothetical protein
MDHLFTKEELISIGKDELIKDERYQIIKGKSIVKFSILIVLYVSFNLETVRSRFKLNHENLNLEWPSLHESILQKRRNEIKKRRSSMCKENSVQSVLHATEDERFDEKNTSDTSEILFS